MKTNLSKEQVLALVANLEKLLPEYIDEEYPKGKKDRGAATVIIILFLFWIKKKMHEKDIQQN